MNMAVPLALIVNDLVTNVVKHVGPPCDIIVHANSRSSLTLTVSDHGSGPEAGDTTQGLGSRIIGASTNQLGATVETKRSSAGYTI
jgi:two-component sensor histidine kinase